jgi:endonuclease YncB( thermonuclease family)
VIVRLPIRLAEIDASELDPAGGLLAKRALTNLSDGQDVTAITHGAVAQKRAVARCRLEDSRDLSAEMVKAGLAQDWHKYCGGCHRHLEPQGVKKRLWRANAHQNGQMPPQMKGGAVTSSLPPRNR